MKRRMIVRSSGLALRGTRILSSSELISCLDVPILKLLKRSNDHSNVSMPREMQLSLG